jgi:hypothetical protein
MCEPPEFDPRDLTDPFGRFGMFGLFALRGARRAGAVAAPGRCRGPDAWAARVSP